jgi:hypothetical protein
MFTELNVSSELSIVEKDVAGFGNSLKESVGFISNTTFGLTATNPSG